MTASIENRQQLSSNNEQERAHREDDARQLVDNIVGRNGEYFANPDNRLEFMQTQGADDFYRMAQHVNARLRNEIPAKLRRDPDEKGAFLMALHTPSHDDKVPAFRNGYRAIQEYITQSTDSTDKKIQSVAMATEALVIWTHPFNDGNGRTSRFLAKLIEEGATDADSLVAETATRNQRNLVYRQKFQTKEGALSEANNNDIMYDDGEREELLAKAESLPNDIDGVYLSVKRLLHNDATQQHAMRYVQVKQSAV